MIVVFISDYLYTLLLFIIKPANIQIFQNGLIFSPFFSDKAQKKIHLVLRWIFA